MREGTIGNYGEEKGTKNEEERRTKAARGRKEEEIREKKLKEGRRTKK